jgi:membrane-bound lytic murein transglycosylase D
MKRHLKKSLFCLALLSLFAVTATAKLTPDTTSLKRSATLAGIDRSCKADELKTSVHNAFTLGPLYCLQIADAEERPAIPVVMNPKVERFIKYFQTKGSWYFAKWLDRTNDYGDLIRGILRKEGLPEDLFYLALIESGLSPKARSKANAVGIWQFIKPTGVRYGLRVDRWIDERRDPEKSTRAAARFLKDLYEEFGSWEMAMAGYNAGEGRVRRSIKRYGTSDYWVLSKYRRGALRRETRSYVPKFMAAMMIAKDPTKYGFDQVKREELAGYELVAISTPTDLRVIAKAAGVGIKEIRRLNPELINWFTPPEYPGYKIKIPGDAAEDFHINFAKIPKPERLRFLRYRLKPGDTIYALALKYGTKVSRIMYFNNLKNPRRIRAGKIIVIPIRARAGKKDKI